MWRGTSAKEIQKRLDFACSLSTVITSYQPLEQLLYALYQSVRRLFVRAVVEVTNGSLEENFVGKRRTQVG